MSRPDEIVERARALAQQGEQTEARQLLLQAIAQDGRNRAAWRLRATLAEDEWEARRAWERLLELDPTDEAARQALSVPEQTTTTVPPPPSTPLPRRPLPWRDLLLAVGQRLIVTLLILLALMIVSFLGLEMARGTPWRAALPEALTATAAYAAQIARGDLGVVSSQQAQLLPRPIAAVLRESLSKSMGLLGLSLLVATLLGLLLGTLAALRRHSAWSVVVLLSTLIGISVPSFFAAILLQRLVIRWGRMTDGPVPIPVGGFGWDAHIILPALVLLARPLAQIARVTFVALSDALEQEYVRTARSKGLRERVVLLRHVFRNGLIPILTTIGLSLRFSLSSLPVVELFFGWPGVGAALLDAIARRDDKLTVALLLSLGLLFILINSLLDFSYRRIDPRLRERSQRQLRQQGTLLGALRTFVQDLGSTLVNNPLARWLRRRGKPATDDPFRELLATGDRTAPTHAARYERERRRTWLRATLRNLPFVLGALLVVGLLLIFLFGPLVAPQSPYTRTLIAMVDGRVQAPPFKPGLDYPWGSDFLGRDMMSLVLAGAQQTLLLAGLVVAGRIAIGLLLGALAGWQQGSRLDRVILSLSEMVAAFPTLILAMLLVLALGIRAGLPPFVVALTLVGWGEVMQFVRSEIFALKPKPFIESAVAIGLHAPRIVVAHVLPNLLPSLIAIAALEMGAVLMLLGELGFVGIFIGGGISTDPDMATGVGLFYSDVPEWGALLSNIHGYTQAYPWMALYPAIAFFLAILAFNLFGEGLRRLVDDVGVNLTRLLNRYTLALALLLFLGWGWVRDNTGEAAVYRQQAARFDGARALADVERLTSPEMAGRAIGTAGADRAADYIAQRFEALGLQRAGEDSSYFQNKARSFQQLSAVPELRIDDGGPPLRYLIDFNETAGRLPIEGEGSGPARLLLFGDPSGGIPRFGIPPFLRSVDFGDEVLLVLSERDMQLAFWTPYRALLVVADDPAQLTHVRTLPGRDGSSPPILRISETTANRLLAAADLTVATARARQAALDPITWESVPLNVAVTARVAGTVQAQVPVRHVIGHLPGDSFLYDDKMIIVMAQYDSPPLNPAGDFSYANDNASGVAVMLELIRAIKESGYQPYKTMLFVAYSGEGLEGGEWVNPPEVKDFLQAKYGFAGNFEVESVIQLRGVGAGSGDHPTFDAGGSLRLSELFGTASRRMDSGAERVIGPLNVGMVGAEGGGIVRSQQDNVIQIQWAGSDEIATVDDEIELVSPDRLERVGEWVGHALMLMGRATDR